MRILITGGLGFVGTRLVEYFCRNRDNHVVISTRKIKKSLEKINFPENSSFINIYSLTEDELERILKGIDTIIHLAALNEIDSVKFLQKAIAVNIGATVTLLEAAKSAGVQKFIYFSTAHVYGSPLIGNIHEAKVCRPSHPYSITHKGAEDFVLAARDTSQIDAIVVRLSNSFGVPAFDTSDRWTLLVNDLCKQAIVKNQLKLRSTGLQYRDFVTLEDVCIGINILLQSIKVDTLDGIFNLGSGKKMTVLEMARLIQKCHQNLFHKKIAIDKPIENNGNTLYNPILNYNINKLKQLGFYPNNSFDMEIGKMLHFCSKKFT